MKYLRPLSSLLVMSLLSTAAIAETPSQGETYFGGGFGIADYELDSNVDLDQDLVNARAGYSVTDYIALEGRFGTSLSDDTISAGGTTIDVSTDWFAGGYGVINAPISDYLSVYGLAGLNHIEVGLTGNEASSGISANTSLSDTSFSYGVGAEIAVSDSFSAYSEWMHYGEVNDADLSGLGFGLLYRYE